MAFLGYSSNGVVNCQVPNKCGINQICSDSNLAGIPVCSCRSGFFLYDGECVVSGCYNGCDGQCIEENGVQFCSDDKNVTCSICQTSPPDQCYILEGVIHCLDDPVCKEGYSGEHCTTDAVPNCSTCHPQKPGICVEFDNVIECTDDAKCLENNYDEFCQGCAPGFFQSNGKCQVDPSLPDQPGLPINPDPPIPCKEEGVICADGGICEMLSGSLQCLCSYPLMYFPEATKCIPTLCPIVNGSVCGENLCIYDPEHQ